jgi:phospholipase A1/A2
MGTSEKNKPATSIQSGEMTLDQLEDDQQNSLFLIFQGLILLCSLLLAGVLSAKELPEPFLKTLETHKPIYIANSWFLNGEGGEQGYDDREVLVQFSFKKNLFWNLYFGYSHRAFLQIYDLENSRSFREQNYNPEAFLEFEELWGMDQLRLGLSEHESNGEKKRVNGEEEINYSRTWDRSYLYLWKNLGQNLGMGLKLWVVTSPKTEEYSAFYDDNADMQQYMGSGEVYLKLGDPLMNLSLMFRRGWKEETETYLVEGLLPIHYLLGLEDMGVDLYVRYFNGFGESLIDYNRRILRFALGVSFR